MTAPVALRERIGEGAGKQLERRLGMMRTRPGASVDERAIFAVMRDLAARARALAVDARRYERELSELVASLDETLLGEVGVGPISAAKLLVGDNHGANRARGQPQANLPSIVSIYWVSRKVWNERYDYDEVKNQSA